MTTELTREQILALVRDGRFFKVRFVKRTDSSVRDMVCRVGVRKYLAGGEKPFEDRDHGLITVFDVQKRAYRSFPVDNILQLRAHGGVVYESPRMTQVMDILPNAKELQA